MSSTRTTRCASGGHRGWRENASRGSPLVRTVRRARKDDRDSDEPIALREDAEECDEGARAAGLDALIREELGKSPRDGTRKGATSPLLVAQQQQTEAMLHGVVNRFALALSAHKVGPKPECEDGAGENSIQTIHPVRHKRGARE